MGKGSSRRREDRARVAANWDVVFGPRITVASEPQTSGEIPAPSAFAEEVLGVTLEPWQRELIDREVAE